MTSRPLQFQTLERRHLLAGGNCADSQPTLSLAESTPPDTSAVSTANLVQASDAGASRGSAYDLGDVDDATRIRGRLGRWDRIDMFRFSVQHDAEVQIDLGQLNRNADLLLANDGGQLLAMSTRSGRRSESIVETLDAGDYFVVVVARSRRTISYQLNVSAALTLPEETPQPPTAPTPTAPTPTAPTPTAPTPTAPTPGQSTPDATNTPALPTASPPVGATPTSSAPNHVQPLADVDYFGGTRDWNLNAVGAPEAWAAGYTGQGITVAVVDTGVDLDHPDLINNLYVNPGEIAGNGIDDDGNGFVDDVHGYDFAGGDANPNDGNGHGTHVAGTIAAGNNGFGATGVAPNATILPVRVLGNDGSGSDRGVADGIRYAASMGAQIINLSLGGGYSRTIQSAINYAQSLGSLIVAAAGNESASSPGYPARFSANYDNVISVGAYNSAGRIAGFSNDVGSSRSVQVDAPGVGVYSTYAGGGYRSISGTSMASPHVAGLAALTLSSNPSLTSKELRDLLSSGVVGTATGSDAFGKADATTTVAYAAAGLTSAAQVAAGSDSAGNRRLASSRVRANQSVDVIAGPLTSISDRSESDEAIRSDSSRLDLPSTVTVERALARDTPVTNSHLNAETVDALFTGEESVADEPDVVDLSATMPA